MPILVMHCLRWLLEHVPLKKCDFSIAFPFPVLFFTFNNKKTSRKNIWKTTARIRWLRIGTKTFKWNEWAWVRLVAFSLTKLQNRIRDAGKKVLNSARGLHFIHCQYMILWVCSWENLNSSVFLYHLSLERKVYTICCRNK